METEISGTEGDERLQLNPQTAEVGKQLQQCDPRLKPLFRLTHSSIGDAVVTSTKPIDYLSKSPVRATHSQADV